MDAEQVYFEPRRVNDIFVAITRLPHGSGGENPVRRYVMELVREYNNSKPEAPVEVVTYHAQPASPGEANIILRRPGTRGRENAPAVVLQAHLDMVCIPSGDIFPLRLEKYADDTGREMLKGGGHSEADGTTLGADDGIGVATAMALLTDRELAPGPLEVVLTVQEETNLGGAMHLDTTGLTGTQFINLDSEDFDIITYGSAGGGNVRYAWRPETEAADGQLTNLGVKLGGLSGGHSGVNIHEGKGNALKILARSLDYLARACGLSFRLASFTTGNDKHNAIPANAEVQILCSAEGEAEVRRRWQQILDCLKQEYLATDPGFHYELAPAPRLERVLSRGATLDLIDILLRIPHGPIKMMPQPAAMVETSCNLAQVAANPEGVMIECSNRSSVDQAMEQVKEMHAGIARLFGIRMVMHLEYRTLRDVFPEGLAGPGGTLVFHSQYPAWQPDENSPLLRVAREVYAGVYGAGKYHSEVIHAGLECGWFIQKYNQAGRRADCIAIGPTVLTPHTWNERLVTSTVAPFYRCVLEIIARVQAL